MESNSPNLSSNDKTFDFKIQAQLIRQNSMTIGNYSPKSNKFTDHFMIGDSPTRKRRSQKMRKNHTIEIILTDSPSPSPKSKKSVNMTESPKNEISSPFEIKLKTADNLAFELTQKKRMQRNVNEKRHRAEYLFERHTMLSVDEPEQITFVNEQDQPDEVNEIIEILENHFIFFFSKKVNCK